MLKFADDRGRSGNSRKWKIAVEKWKLLPKGSYDLIFMDIQMPVMRWLWRQLQQSGAFRVKRGKLPVTGFYVITKRITMNRVNSNIYTFEQ